MVGRAKENERKLGTREGEWIFLCPCADMYMDMYMYISLFHHERERGTEKSLFISARGRAQFDKEGLKLNSPRAPIRRIKFARMDFCSHGIRIINRSTFPSSHRYY